MRPICTQLTPLMNKFTAKKLQFLGIHTIAYLVQISPETAKVPTWVIDNSSTGLAITSPKPAITRPCELKKII